MTTLTWNGGTHRFFLPNAWSPTGVPEAGDTLFIGTGKAVAHGGVLSGLTIRLDAPYLGELPQTVSGPGPVLKLEDTTVAADTLISLGGIVAGGSTSATIEADGHTVNFGTITNGAITSVGPPDGPPTTLTIDVGGRRGGELVNDGTLSVTPQVLALSKMVVQGESRGSTLVNDGLIQSQGTVSLDIDVIGQGNIAFGAVFDATHDGPPIGATVELERAVGKDQTVDFGTGVQGPFNTGTDSHGGLLLDDPARFCGVIADFAASSIGNIGGLHPDEIVLQNTDITSFSYQGNAQGGVLTLRDGHDTVGRLQFAGSYTEDEFQVSHPTATSSVIELKPPI